MIFSDTIADLNHAAAKHKIAVRPNNRRTPSRLTNNGANNPDDEENDENENDQNENGKLENELIDRNFKEGSSVLPILPI